MTSPALRERLANLVPGQHVDVDGLVESPPPPGHRDWLPSLLGIAHFLASIGGRWIISLPLGTTTSMPTTGLLDEVVSSVSTEGLLEPPSVYRMVPVECPDRWEGENHRWSTRVSDSTIQVVSINRSHLEAEEPFTASVLFEVWSE